MEKLRSVLYFVISTVAIFIAVASILSIFRNTDSRFLKMLDFPRIQLFIVSFVSLILFYFFTKKWKWYDYLLVAGLVLGMVVQGIYLKNYTFLTSPTVPQVVDQNYSKEKEISLLLANVKMTNRKSQPLIDLLKGNKPDVFIAMEIDDWWERELEVIEADYPYRQETINSVKYGMTLYSKFPFKDMEVNYLNNNKVPSFESRLQLKNGKEFLLYSVHPVPPTHYKDLPDNEGQEEEAMEKLGKKIEKSKVPVILAGDFNDVSWGYTNALTKTEDMLFDVRVGRGFYNSYNADNIFMRWPLDHVFVTKEFSLVELKRLENIGSDHYPIYAKLVLQ